MLVFDQTWRVDHESWGFDRHKSVEIPIQDDLNKIQPTTSKKKTPWQSNQNTPKLTQNQQNASKTNTEQLGLKFFTFTRTDWDTASPVMVLQDLAQQGERPVF